MNLDSLKTARHIEEIMQHPNPMVLEATKAFFNGQKLGMEPIGADFLKIYLETEAQMYAYLERTKREEESKRPQFLSDTFLADTLEKASESPKFKI